MLKEYKEIYKEAHNKAEQIKIFLVSNIREKTDNFSRPFQVLCKR